MVTRLLALALLCAAAHAQELVFRASASNLWIQPNRLAAARKPAGTVEVVLPGRLHVPPLRLDAIERAKTDRSTPEKAAAGDFAAFKADDDAWILENFVSEEHPKVREFLNDPDARRRNQAAMERRSNELIFGRCAFQDYVLLMIGYNQDKRASLLAAYKKTAAGWKRTNALANDHTFDVLFTAVRASAVTTR